jgi:hypothetical protein
VPRDAAAIDAALATTVAHQPAFVAAWRDDAYKLTLSPDVSPVGEGVQAHRALQKYDPIVVDALFARAIPGATVTHTLDAGEALAAELALILRPLTIDQVTHASDLGELLPAGASAFAPAIAPLITFEVNDEELV